MFNTFLIRNIFFLLQWSKLKMLRVGFLSGKSNQKKSSITLQNAGANSEAGTYFSNWEKVCESGVCVRAHTSFHQVSLTSQTLAHKGLGTGSSPHTGAVRGC